MRAAFMRSLGAALLACLPGTVRSAEPTDRDEAEPGAAKPAPAEAHPSVPPTSQSTLEPAGGAPCGGGFRDCAPCDGAGWLTSGAGFYCFQPDFGSNPAYTVSRLSTASSFQRDFDWDPGFAPLVWLSYVDNNGAGARARFWMFDQTARENLVNSDSSGDLLIRSAEPLGWHVDSPGLVLNKGGTDTLTYEHGLQMHVLDLEALHERSFNPWVVTVSGGLRYAQMTQRYNVVRVDPPQGTGTLPGCTPSGSQPNKCDTIIPPPGTGGGGGGGGLDAAAVPVVVIEDFDLLTARRRYDGFGPTVAVEARRPVGEGGLNVYGSGRASVLFGRSRQEAALFGLIRGEYVVSPGPNVPFSGVGFDSVRKDRTIVMPVVELETGLRWEAEAGPGRVFTQVGLAYQAWFHAGDAATDRGQLNLFGLNVAAGLSY